MESMSERCSLNAFPNEKVELHNVRVALPRLTWIQGSHDVVQLDSYILVQPLSPLHLNFNLSLCISLLIPYITTC